MESFSKFASKLERNMNINRYDADRSRSERRVDRDYSERRRASQSSVSIDQIKSTINDCNENQLDVIQDFFDDNRVDRDASSKEILRAVDANAKLINKGVRLISDFKDEWEDEDRVDYKELSESAKNEILKAVFSNTDILNILKEQLVDNKESDVFDKQTAEKMNADMEDHVHKEAVKCYRNVQAVIIEQDEKNVAKLKKSIGVVKGLVITALLMGAANLAFLLCQYFKLI